MGRKVLSRAGLSGAKSTGFQQHEARLVWSQTQVRPWLEGGGRRGDAQTRLREDAVASIDQWEPTATIYTDGSALEGRRLGGSAAVWTVGSAANPVVRKVARCSGRKLTCSFETEVEALRLATAMLEDEEVGDAGGRVVVATDSQAILRVLAVPGGRVADRDLAEVWRRLSLLPWDVTLQWVPGHCGLPGNELADAQANIAAGREARGQALPGGVPVVARGREGIEAEVSWGAARTVLRETTLSRQASHPRVREVYGRVRDGQQQEDSHSSSFFSPPLFRWKGAAGGWRC